MNSTETIKDLQLKLKQEKKKLDKVSKKMRTANDYQYGNLEFEWYEILDRISILNFDIEKLKNAKSAEIPLQQPSTHLRIAQNYGMIVPTLKSDMTELFSHKDLEEFAEFLNVDYEDYYQLYYQLPDEDEDVILTLTSKY